MRQFLIILKIKVKIYFNKINYFKIKLTKIKIKLTNLIIFKIKKIS